MRRLIVLALLGALLALAVVVLYALGRAGITSEARRLQQDARRARAAALEAARDALAADLEALRAREDNRVWYHYRPLFLPPDLVATTLALVPSELTRRPEDPLVSYHFELRDGQLTSPALLDDEGAYAAEVREALARLAPLAGAIERELAAPAGQPARELMDAFVCETNAAPGLKLQQLAETRDEPGQAQLKNEWEAYQSRVGKQSGSFARAQPQRSSQPVEVRVYPLRWVSHGVDRDGWPEVVVAARRVEAAGQAWVQGFALDLRRLRQAHLPALLARARAPERRDGRGWRELDRELVALEGSLPAVSARSGPPPETVRVLAAAATPDLPAARLAPPLERLALVDTAPPVDARGLLAGTRALLDGALALAVVVVVLGGAIVTLAARSERRLARQRSDFVAALTHELKAPLTGFRALTELLHDGLVSDEQKKREYYASMLAESERLSRLVQNVLDASRLERGALQVVAGPLDPRPLLDDVVARFRPRLESEGFRLEVDVADDLPATVADREAFAHVVGNLLDNASKYGRGDELVIRLEARVVVDHAGSWLRVLVADRGPGVPPAHRRRVFERFYRGDAPRQVGGAGLGLTIARALSLAMGGELTLEEADAPGARFGLRLPLAAPAARAA